MGCHWFASAAQAGHIPFFRGTASGSQLSRIRIFEGTGLIRLLSEALKIAKWAGSLSKHVSCT